MLSGFLVKFVRSIFLSMRRDKQDERCDEIRDASIPGPCCQRLHFSVVRVVCSANLLELFYLVLVALSLVIIRFHGIW